MSGSLGPRMAVDLQPFLHEVSPKQKTKHPEVYPVKKGLNFSQQFVNNFITNSSQVVPLAYVDTAADGISDVIAEFKNKGYTHVKVVVFDTNGPKFTKIVVSIDEFDIANAQEQLSQFQTVRLYACRDFDDHLLKKGWVHVDADDLAAVATIKSKNSQVNATRSVIGSLVHSKNSNMNHTDVAIHSHVKRTDVRVLRAPSGRIYAKPMKKPSALGSYNDKSDTIKSHHVPKGDPATLNTGSYSIKAANNFMKAANANNALSILRLSSSSLYIDTQDNQNKAYEGHIDLGTGRTPGNYASNIVSALKTDLKSTETLKATFSLTADQERVWETAIPGLKSVGDAITLYDSGSKMLRLTYKSLSKLEYTYNK